MSKAIYEPVGKALTNNNLNANSMAKDTIIYGKRCRWYIAYYVWVSDDGTLVVLPDKFNTNGMKKIAITTDHDGKKIAYNSYGDFVDVAKAVAVCFCPPKPKDGKKYVIGHKDGNLDNCHYLNLEWVPYHYQHATTNTVKLSGYSLTLEVGKDGSVKMGGKAAKVYDSFYDSDVELELCSSGPFIYLPQKGSLYDKRVFIDDLMCEAGYIQGDDADLQYPMILHKDNDYMNCSSENLEFVELTDERYEAFLEQRMKDKHEKVVEKNPGKHVPDNF